MEAGRRSRSVILGVALALVLATVTPAAAQEEGDETAASETAAALVFPVAGDHTFVDTFGAPRPQGRTHAGTDIFADKRTPVVSIADGVVVRVAIGDTAGNYIVVRHDDGSRSYYLHLNNDTDGTDDGEGWEPVDGIVEGATVAAGELLNYVGDSGNAEGTPPHLHFEFHAGSGETLNPFPYLVAARAGEAPPPTSDEAGEAPAAETRSAQTIALGAGAQLFNTAVVAHVDLGGGFNADLALHDDHVYVGSWGRPGACPSHGIRILDVAHPSMPELLGAFATGDEFPGTYTENVWVGSVEMASFSGDLALVGVRLCDNSERGRYRPGFRGLAAYDVTDPAAPLLLSTLDTGERTQGVHEMAVARTLTGSLRIAVTVLQSHLHHPDGTGDVRIIETTDLRDLAEVADWDLRRDGPPELVAELMATRGDEELHAHGVTLGDDGARAYVSHWDAGTVVLDLTVPLAPAFAGITGFADGEEGNGHSVWVGETADVIIQNSEDLYPSEVRGDDPYSDHESGWGYQRIYRGMELLSTFATENAVPGEDGEIGLDGFYTVHNTEVLGSVEYASWYSDGLRIVDVGDPAAPTEIGHFVPPKAPDPQGYWMAPDGTTAFPMVWGVGIAKNVVYLSDINSGLWVVRFDDPDAGSENDQVR